MTIGTISKTTLRKLLGNFSTACSSMVTGEGAWDFISKTLKRERRTERERETHTHTHTHTHTKRETDRQADRD